MTLAQIMGLIFQAARSTDKNCAALIVTKLYSGVL